MRDIFCYTKQTEVHSILGYKGVSFLTACVETVIDFTFLQLSFPEKTNRYRGKAGSVGP
jgi:hypothetical protein